MTVDLLTAKLDHIATDWLKLSNTLRAGYYTRDATTTAPRVNASSRDAPSAIRVTRSPSQPGQRDADRQQPDDGDGRFHDRAARPYSGRRVRAWFDVPIPSASASPDWPTASLFDPDPNAGVGTPRGLTTDTSAEATTVGVYAFDQIKLTDQWSIVGGLRWDRFDAESEEKVNGVSLDRTDNDVEHAGGGAVSSRDRPARTTMPPTGPASIHRPS